MSDAPNPPRPPGWRVEFSQTGYTVYGPDGKVQHQVKDEHHASPLTNEQRGWQWVADHVQ